MNSSGVQLQSVTKSYRQADRSLQVLSSVDLKIPMGETVSLMGRSGGGKSTLISLIAGLDTPDSGQVFVEGQALASLSQIALNQFRARRIGIIFQQFFLLDHLTALENVKLPLDLDGDKQAKQKAEDWLKRVGLAERAHHYPDQMSRGECQRVAIARGLIRGPHVLLADEPTGSLDVQTGQEVMQLVMDLQKTEKFLLFLVTHDPVYASLCQTQFKLVDGQLERSK